VIVSESYLFVLIISSALFVPIGLAIRTLLSMNEHVILPILRLRITNDLTATKSSETVSTATVIQGKAIPSIHAGRRSW
jgi:hypothetical protein